MSGRRVFTVSELTRQIKLILEANLPTLWVEGEICNFTWHSSGHMYFSLKDKHAQLRCVMWQSYNQHLFFTPGEGMQVQAQGNITLYEKNGQYQLSITQMNPVGRGELRLAFERLAERLRTEGLFRQELKKPLPPFPACIGVVTSPSGAAIQDIVRAVSRRFPPARIILRPTPVQGEGSAEEIARAIEELNVDGRAEIIVVGRGGGPPEDLWAFNEERVARAIFASAIPVVSAVGHEIDLTISDLVADVRAPTPSAAGEMIVPDKREVLVLLQTLHGRMAKALEAGLAFRSNRLDGLGRSHGMLRCADLLDQKMQFIDQVAERLDIAWHSFRGQRESALRASVQRLKALDPRAVLGRGYSICRRAADGKVVSDARRLRRGQNVDVIFARGSIDALVQRIRARGLRKTQRRERDG